MSSLYETSETGSRFQQLVELRNKLAVAIDSCESMRDLASLSRQYREIIREIEEIEGNETEDEIADILKGREANGKSRSVRPNRTKVQDK